MSNEQRESAQKPDRPSDRELDRAAPSLAGGREIQVGLFVLVGIVAFVAVLFLLTDPATFRGRYMVLTEVSDAGGIRRGDPVQMRGVNIGRVDRFDLIDDAVRITLEIEGQWEIPSDSRTLLGGTDLLGGRTVQVSPGESGEALQPGQLMPGRSEEGVMDLADSIGQEARATLERVRILMADSAIGNVHSSIEELEALISTLSQITEGQRDDLAELSGSLARSANQVEDLTGREELGRSIARADSTLAELQAAGGNLSRASASLEEVLGRIERGEGTLGRLSGEEGLYESLDATLEEIRLLARDLRDNPDRYINLRIF